MTQTSGSPEIRMTQDQIQAVIDHLRESGVSSKAVRLMETVIVRFFDKAVGLGFLAQNPIQLSAHPKQMAGPPMMTGTQVRRLVDEAEKTSPELAALILCISEGLRPKEALALTWQDVDPVVGTLDLRRSRRTNVTVSMSRGLMNRLQRCRELQRVASSSMAPTEASPVFASGASYPILRNLERQIAALGDRLGFPATLLAIRRYGSRTRAAGRGKA